MKKLIAIGAGALLLNLSALAQGTILLQNFGSGFTTSGVKDPNGVLLGANSPYTIELLAGTTAASVTPFTTPITESFWPGGGYFGFGDPAGAQRVLTGF